MNLLMLVAPNSFHLHLTSVVHACTGCTVSAYEIPPPNSIQSPLLMQTEFHQVLLHTLITSLPTRLQSSNRLQLAMNSAARAVTKTPKFHHITPILKSFYWVKINKRIKYKVLSLPYKSLNTGQLSYLRSLLSFSSHRCPWSSSPINLSRPSLTSRLKLQIDLITILLLFSGTVSHLIYVTLLITSLLHLY